MRMPKFNRVGRLFIGLFGPGIVASFLIVAFIIVPAAIDERLSIEIFLKAPKDFVILFLTGSFFIGLQSLVYTIVMEFVIRPRVLLRATYLVASCIMGAASGLIIDALIDSHPFFSFCGTVTGLLTGLILYDKEVQYSHNKRMQPDILLATRAKRR